MESRSDTGAADRKFQPGDQVVVRDYLHDHKWTSGVVHTKEGPRSYTVETQAGAVWRRHPDQMRSSEVPMLPPPAAVTSSMSEDMPTHIPGNTPSKPEPVAMPSPAKTVVRRSARARRAPDRLDL